MMEDPPNRKRGGNCSPPSPPRFKLRGQTVAGPNIPRRVCGRGRGRTREAQAEGDGPVSARDTALRHPARRLLHGVRAQVRLEATFTAPKCSDLPRGRTNTPPQVPQERPPRAPLSRSTRGRTTGTPSTSAWNCMTGGVADGAAVDAGLRRRRCRRPPPSLAVHRRLVGHAVEGGARQVGADAAAGQSEDGTASVRVPVGSAKPGE